MSLDTWLIYLAAAIGLSLSPGPNGLLALTHGALYGHRKASWTVFGGVLGFARDMLIAAMLGMAPLAASTAATPADGALPVEASAAAIELPDGNAPPSARPSTVLNAPATRPL